MKKENQNYLISGFFLGISIGSSLTYLVMTLFR